MKNLFLLVIFSIGMNARALSLPDSLHAQAWAGAVASDQRPAGLKGSASALVAAQTEHYFTNALFCRLYLEGTPSFSTPFVKEASLGCRRADLTAKAGMLFTALGRANLYKPFSIFNRFTRTSVIWDSYGFGVSLDQRLGGMAFAGAVTLNE
ncbi:MAG: hypothetical protein PHC61_06140, partial [Chitinivibrionales bacterium]|nr:hypothetical protein [Chitinivibrionales bacterium]